MQIHNSVYLPFWRHAQQGAVLAGLCLLLGGCGFTSKAQSSQKEPECWTLQAQGKKAEARQCFLKLTDGGTPYLRAEGYFGIGNFEQSNVEFRSAAQQAPKSAHVRLRWGKMFLAHWQAETAEELFQEAIKLEPTLAQAHLGLAEAMSEKFQGGAMAVAEQAAKLDPKLVEAREMIARLALEESNWDRARTEAEKALEMSPKALGAMSVLATLDWLADKPSTPWPAKALAVNPAYGELHAFAGRQMVMNRRYEEAIQHYREALQIDPDLSNARSELGVQLMRVGKEEEARKELEIAYEKPTLYYEKGFRNPATANSLKLLDSYSNFETFTTDNTILKLDKKEAALLRPYFEGEMKRAIATYEKKYRVKLPEKVQVEVFPNHEDFAVRALGMPGLGALGVTFGHVVAMDSPSGRKPGSFHWASTLWHELSHVYVLTATRHRVPRWFTEGMAVYEETAISPDWGDRVDGLTIKAIKDKKLLPIAELDSGFQKPDYPGQVLVSYFQAGRICNYIEQTWGFDTLLGMMQAFGKSKTTPQVVQEQLKISPEQFDKQFMAWLDGQLGKTVASYDEWNRRRKALSDLARASKHQEVIKEGVAVRDLFPDYVERGSVYEMLADAYVAMGDKPAAISQLTRYSEAGGRDPETLKKLAAWQQEAGQKAEAAKTWRRLSFVYLQDDTMHRQWGTLAMETGDKDAAVREFGAVVASQPADAAQAHYDYARALLAAKRNDEAREQVMLSLEAAPGFKPAQKLLLQLSSGGSSD